MSQPPTRQNRRLPAVLLIGILCVAGVLAVARGALTGKPTAFTEARPNPTQATRHDGAWYWIESEVEKAARLIRADGDGRKEIASASQILDYSISSGKAAWSASDGKSWSIFAASADGSSKLEVFRGGQPAGGVWTDGKRVYWLEQTPPALPESGPFPPLESRVKVMSAPVDGGTPATHATLMEPEGQAVIGLHDDSLYVATVRPGGLGSTAFYRVPLDGSPAERVGGSVARQNGLLTGRGELYWMGPSREASQPHTMSSVYRRSTRGKVEALTDWLPSGGRLFEIGGRVFYIDGLYTSNAWPIGESRDLPRPLRKPRDLAVVGIGEGEMLLRPFPEGRPHAITLYRAGMP